MRIRFLASCFPKTSFKDVKPTASSTTPVAVPQRTPWLAVRQNEGVVLDTPKKTFFRRFMLLPYSANVVKVGFCLLTVGFFGAGASNSQVLACGLNTRLPQGPFMSQASGDYRLLYSEKWGDLRISPKITLEVGVLFTPILNYSNSRLLGPGWEFPIIQSVALPISEKEIEMILPTGHRERLKRTKVANQFRGGNWLATINGRDLAAKSSCGWELRFQQGRLKTLKTPDGVEVIFSQDAQGNYSVTAGKTVVLTLKSAYDDNIQKICHLNFQGGKHAILCFGSRSMLMKVAEKDVFGRDKEKEIDVTTLRSIQWDGEVVRQFEFMRDKMKIAGKLFKWDSANNLIWGDGTKYSFQTIRGIKCLKTEYADGRIMLQGHKKNQMSVQQLPNGVIEITEWIRNLGQGNRKTVPHKVFALKNGAEELIRQHWYDEDGRETRLLIKTSEDVIQYTRSANSLVAKDVNTGKIIWTKKYDIIGNIVEFQDEIRLYRFERGNKDGAYKIIQISPIERREKLVTKVVFDLFTEKL